MIIEENDFRLIPISDFCFLFDLELLYKVQPRGGEPRMEFKNVAYGISLENAIKRIAHYRVCTNHLENNTNLLTYFKEFKKELDSLKTLCEV